MAPKQARALKRRIAEREQQEIELRQQLRGMRPAEDVFHRIKWDASLDSDDFAVCFLGLDPLAPPGEEVRILLECPFDEFEPDVVPMHVVRKFKFRGLLVWDREQQIDDFFGSSTIRQQTEGRRKRRAPRTIEQIMDALARHDAANPPATEG